MFRQFDFECLGCGRKGGHIVEIRAGRKPPPLGGKMQVECDSCGWEAHVRIPSIPAMYTGDRPWAPYISGGRHDTQGNRQPPPLPELPAGADFNDAREFFKSKEFNENRRERQEVLIQNKLKKQRNAAMKKHPTMDMRNTPVPGDPKRP